MMANVYGDVSTWGLDAFPEDQRLLVKFLPSSAAVGLGYVLPEDPVLVEPDTDGTFSQNLAPTVELLPDCWYEVRFEWFRKHPIKDEWELAGWSELPGRLRVPLEGGEISTLFDMSAARNLVPLYFGHGEPPEWLPSGGVYFDLDDPEGAGVYSEGQVV